MVRDFEVVGPSSALLSTGLSYLTSTAISGWLASTIVLILEVTDFTDLSEGLIISTVGWLVDLFNLGLKGFLEILNPRKSNPSCILTSLVFASLSSRSLTARNFWMISLTWRRIFSSLPVITISSANLQTYTLVFPPLTFLLTGYNLCIAASIPLRAMLHSVGDITPPAKQRSSFVCAMFDSFKDIP